MRYIKRYKKTVLIIVLAMILVSPCFVRYIEENKLEIIQSNVVSHFIPLYRSLRKLPDIFFIPIYAFSPSKLETFNLSIAPGDIQRMNDELPDSPFGLQVQNEENKLWVSADFRSSGYADRVKVRYRGNKNGHWNSYKKSYLIKFPKENLFRGMRELTLVIPVDRAYFAMDLNNYRSKKLGLIVPELDYINLNINGANNGNYLSFEHWSKEWVERAGIDPNSVLIGSSDYVPEAEGKTFYSKEGVLFWDSWNVDVPLASYPFAAAVVEIVEHADNATFAKLIPRVIDLDSFYSRDVVSILSGGYHSASEAVTDNNLVLYFDAIEGRLKPIPYNSSLQQVVDGEEFPGNPTELQKRLLDIPEFKKERADYFYKYVEENKEDDIAHLNSWLERMNSEFFRDNAKIDNNIQYYRDIKKFEGLVLEYFTDPFQKVNDSESYVPMERVERELTFEDTFVYLKDTVLTPQEFVRKNGEFYVSDSSIVLKKGTHFLTHDIIIPVNTKLLIQPGTTLLMDEGVSLISYSPVEANGTADEKIRIVAADISKPWGVFAIINTEERENIIENTILSSGKDDKINGVYFSGMLALHNANGIIKNSTIMNAKADDGINVKKGTITISDNTFSGNSSDSLDVDYALEGSSVSNNIFLDSGGDSIDLSWSDILIESNIIINCGDKGVSVGERSNPNLVKNTIVGCNSGIAVKDLSKVVATQNKLIGNNIAVEAFQKKSIFGGGDVEIDGGVIWNNGRESRADDESIIVLKENIERSEPTFDELDLYLLNKLHESLEKP